MIDVIIPAYNAHATINKTLESIEYQTIKNKLKVYIVDDCSNESYDYLKNNYDLDITIYRLDKNGGPGVARQYGIDHSNSEYITFIDADDILLNSDSIEVMYNTIYDGYDVGVTSFMEQMDNDVKVISNDSIWMHGKIYRRSFLEDNNIRFNDSRQNEDYGVNKLILLSDAKINYSDYITYLWQNNKSSITRRNNQEYLYTGLFGYIYNATYALNLAYKRGYDIHKIGLLATEVIIVIYFSYLQYSYKEDIEVLLKNSKDILNMYKKTKLSNNEEKELYEKIYSDFCNDINVRKCIISFDDFIEKLEYI